MNPEKWQKAKEIFNAVLECEESRRAGFLRDACRQDEELRREVEAMLASFAKAEDFLEGFSVPAPFKLADQSGGEILVGRRVGQYALVKEIGRGGMGAVFLASRAD